MIFSGIPGRNGKNNELPTFDAPAGKVKADFVDRWAGLRFVWVRPRNSSAWASCEIPTQVIMTWSFLHPKMTSTAPEVAAIASAQAVPNSCIVSMSVPV